MTRILVAITAASGTTYGVQLVRRLLDCGDDVLVIVSDAARKVLAVERAADGRLEDVLRPARFLAAGDVAALPASGSSAPDAMFVAPCSMGTAARIATGASTNLIERAADVMLKERRPLVLVPRETPLSTLHLRNLLTLSELGARIVMASPGFYFRPGSIDELVEFVVDRAIQAAGLPHPLRHPWTGMPS